MKITMTKRNGFIQLPILAWVGIFVLGALTAGTGAVVISGKSPAALLASISSQFAKEDILDEPELILSEETTPNPIQEELEKAKQEIERLQQEKEEALKQAQQQAQSEAELKALSALQKQIEDAQRRLAETQAQAEAQAKAKAESKEVIVEPQVSAGLEISSVVVIHKGDFSRIGWKTSKPSEAKLQIWPVHEIPSNASTTSPSRSDTHYLDIYYNNFPIYSPGTSFINSYLSYNYRIEATSGELSASKEGNFIVAKETNFNPDWIANKMALNPNLSCAAVSSVDLERLFCKNYRSYHGKGD